MADIYFGLIMFIVLFLYGYASILSGKDKNKKL